jgi:hypothetical protein
LRNLHRFSDNFESDFAKFFYSDERFFTPVQKVYPSLQKAFRVEYRYEHIVGVIEFAYICVYQTDFGNTFQNQQSHFRIYAG